MTLSRYERKRSLTGVIAAMAVVNLVYGITFPLLALVLDGQGVSKTLIGLDGEPAGHDHAAEAENHRPHEQRKHPGSCLSSALERGGVAFVETELAGLEQTTHDLPAPGVG